MVWRIEGEGTVFPVVQLRSSLCPINRAQETTTKSAQAVLRQARALRAVAAAGLLPVLDGSGSIQRVWVLGDGAAVPVALTPGISDGHMTEIIGGELEVGMLVIVDQKTEAEQ